MVVVEIQIEHTLVRGADGLQIGAVFGENRPAAFFSCGGRRRDCAHLHARERQDGDAFTGCNGQRKQNCTGRGEARDDA